MLPAYPWLTRPVDQPLTAEEVCEALWMAEGSIVLAAERLKVGSLVLRKFVERSTRARAVIRETIDCLSDEAVRTLRAALRDDEARRQDWAIRYILQSKNAAKEGWGSRDEANPAVQGPLINLTGPTTIQWGDGSKYSAPSPPAPVTIDVVPSSASTSADDGN